MDDEAGDAGRRVDGGPATGETEIADAAEESVECPACGASLPAGARFCPECATAIDEDGAAVDLADLDGDILPADPTELLVEDDSGLRRASGRVRVLAGLAVSIPLAPLVLFLVGSVVSLSAWTGALVFLGGWFGSAAILSRARVPAEAFGRSLYLIAVGTLLIPVAVEVGGGALWTRVSFDTVAAVSLALAGACIVLGTFVTNQATKRVTGERRAFEDQRGDSE
jgi:hypothetical protein